MKLRRALQALVLFGAATGSPEIGFGKGIVAVAEALEETSTNGSAR